MSKALRQPATPTGLTGTVAALTVPQLRGILAEHECGSFLRSALLAELAKRHTSVAGALEQRLAGAVGLPFELECADASTNAQGLCARVEARWPKVFPRGVQRLVLQDRVMVGFCFVRITGTYDPGLDEIVPYMERWHPGLCRFEAYTGCWYAQTETGEALVVDAEGRVAEGWCVSFVTDRLTSFLEGAVRAVGEPFLGGQFAERDTRRFSERMGQGIVAAKVPGQQAETEEAKRFTAAVERVGATGVIVLPQYSDKDPDAPSPSYDLALLFPPAEGMKGLLALDDHEASKIRLRILGQDTTSKDSTGGGFARSKTGEGVRQDLTQGDAEALEELASQLFDAWALLENRPRRLFPCAEWDATPPEDKTATASQRAQSAQALGTLATALPALVAAATAAGQQIDVAELFERFGVPLLTPETSDA